MCVAKTLLVGILGGGEAQAQGLDVERWLRRPGVKLVAVEFYATWCKPCMAAVPKWKALHEKYAKDGLRLIVVATQDADGACANPGWSPDEVICDDDGFLAKRFGAESLPAAYLWGWQGHLLAKKVYVEQLEAQIEGWMQRTPRVLVQVGKVGRGSGIGRRDLLSAVRSEIGRTDKITVVATDREKEQLRAMVKKSLSLNANEKLQCQVGQEVSANSILTARITGRRKKSLRLELMSAERGCLVASASTMWNPRKVAVSIGEGVAELTGRLRLAKPQYPWPGSKPTFQEREPVRGWSVPHENDSYVALLAKAEAAKQAVADAEAVSLAAEKAAHARRAEVEARAAVEKAERMKRLEAAWSSVSQIVESVALSKQERLGALSIFIGDFPSDNPYLDTARDYAHLLKKGRNPPLGMVLVPSGDFYAGCKRQEHPDCIDDEKPSSRAFVATFRLDVTEVTVAAYRRCVRKGACTKHMFQTRDDNRYCNWGHPKRGQHPMNCVSWLGAATYCRWAGKRLPTSMEWEKAARGVDGRRFPWGNSEASCTYAVVAEERKTVRAGCGRDSTWVVGSKPAGASPYRAHDMSGNVWEWVSDWYSQRKEFRSIRGGSWNSEASETRPSYPGGMAPASRVESVGFRCAAGRSPL